jgi:hypothetical protein
MVGRLLLVGAMALSACGDDDDDIAAPDAAMSDALPWPADALPRMDAGPTADAAPAVDGAVVDASGIDGGLLLPDLTAEGITRGVSYRVQYCNRGTAHVEGTFAVRITNVATSETFETSVAFSVPLPGACTETGDITCGLIGDGAPSKCSLEGEVFAFVDSSNVIEELDESNNQIVITF